MKPFKRLRGRKQTPVKKLSKQARRRPIVERLEDRLLMASFDYRASVVTLDAQEVVTLSEKGGYISIKTNKAWGGDGAGYYLDRNDDKSLVVSADRRYAYKIEGDGTVNIGDGVSVIGSKVTLNVTNLIVRGTMKFSNLETNSISIDTRSTLQATNWTMIYTPDRRRQTAYRLRSVNVENFEVKVTGADIEFRRNSTQSSNFTLETSDFEKIAAGVKNLTFTTNQSIKLSTFLPLDFESKPNLRLIADKEISVGGSINLAASATAMLSAGAGVSFPNSGNDASRSLRIEGNKQLNLKLDGSEADTKYERLVLAAATSNLQLDGIKLNLLGDYIPKVGDVLTIVSLTPEANGSAKIVGTFADLPNGAQLRFNGQAMRIAYTDFAVTLTPTGAGSGPEITLTAAGPIIAPGENRAATLEEGTDFGNVRLDGSFRRTFTLRNTGLSDLSLSGAQPIVLTGDPRFRVISQPATGVGARQSTSFEVEYQAGSAPGPASTIVSFQSNSPLVPNFKFRLSATTLAGEQLAAGTSIDSNGIRVLLVDSGLRMGDGRVTSSGRVQLGLVPQQNRTFIPLLQTTSGQSILQTDGKFETESDLVAPTIDGAAAGYKPLVVFRRPAAGTPRTIIDFNQLTSSSGLSSDRFASLPVLDELFFTPTRLRFALNVGNDPQIELRGGRFTDNWLPDDYNFSFGDREDVNKDGNTEIHPTDYIVINPRVSGGRGLEMTYLKGKVYPGSTSINLNQPRPDKPIAPGPLYYAREASLSFERGWSITGAGTVSIGLVKLPATYVSQDILDSTGRVLPPTKASIQNTSDRDGKTVYEAFRFAGVNLQSNNFRTRISPDVSQATLYWTTFTGTIPGGFLELQSEPDGTRQMVLFADGRRDFKFLAPGSGYSRLWLGDIQVDFTKDNAFSYDPGLDTFSGAGDVTIRLPRTDLKATISTSTPLKISPKSVSIPSSQFPGQTETSVVPTLNTLTFDIAAGTRIAISDTESITAKANAQIKFEPSQSAWTLIGTYDYANNEAAINAVLVLDGTKADGSKTLGFQYTAGRFVGGDAVVASFVYNQPTYPLPFSPNAPGSLVARVSANLNSTIVPGTNPPRTNVTFVNQMQITGAATLKIQGVDTRVGLGDENTAGVQYARPAGGEATRLIDFMIYPADRNRLVTVGGVSLGGELLRGLARNALAVQISGEFSLPIGDEAVDATFSIKLTGADTIDPQLRLSTISVGGVKLTSISTDPLRSSPTSTNSKLILIGGAKATIVENRKTDVQLSDAAGIVIENGVIASAKFNLKEFVLGNVVFRPENLVGQFIPGRGIWQVTGTARMSNSTPDTYLWDFGGNSTNGLEFNGRGLVSIGFTNREEVNFQTIKFAPNALTSKYDPSRQLYTLIGQGRFVGAAGTQNVTVGEDPTKAQYLIEKGICKLLNFRPDDTNFTVGGGGLRISTNGLNFRIEGRQVIYTGRAELSHPQANNFNSLATQHYITVDLGANGTRGMIFVNGVFESLEGIFVNIQEKEYPGLGSTAVVLPNDDTIRVNGNSKEFTIFGLGKFIVDTNLASVTPSAPGRNGTLQLSVTFEYKSSEENFKPVYLWRNTAKEDMKLGDTTLSPEGGYFELSRTNKRRFDVLGYWRIKAAQATQLTLFKMDEFYLNDGPVRFMVPLNNPVSFGGTVMTPSGAYIVFSQGKGTYGGEFSIPVFNDAVGKIYISSDRLQVDSKGKLKLDGIQLSVASSSLGGSAGKKGFTMKGMVLSYRTEEYVDKATGETKSRQIATGTATIALRSGLELGCTVELVDNALRSVEVRAEGDRLIPIAGGVVTITRISAKLDNLDDADNFKLIGSVSATIGPRVNIFGKKVQLADATGTIEISKSELVIGGNVRIAEGWLGSGSGSITFFFDSQSTHVVVLTAEYNLLPGDIVHGQIDFKLARSGDVDFDGSLEFRVPSGVPIIGGVKVATASVQVRIRPNAAPENSYVRGEASIILLGSFDAKVDFGGTVDIGVRPFFAIRFSKTFTLPGIRNTTDGTSSIFGADFLKPTIAINSVEPIPGTSKAKITYTATADAALSEGTLVDLYVDTSSSGGQGVLIGTVAYQSGTHEFVWEDFGQYSPIPYDPKHVIYVYAGINDGEHFGVYSDYSPPVHLPDFTPTIRLPEKQRVDAGGTLVFDAAAHNTIEIVDPLEALAPDEQVELIVDSNYGDLHLTATSSTVSITGQDTTRLRLIGTASDITDVLAGLEYRRDDKASSDEQLYFSLTRSPAQFTTRMEAVLDIDVNTIVISVNGSNNSDKDKEAADYTQGSGGDQLLSDLSISDFGGAFGTKVTVSLTGYVPGEDMLAYDSIFTPEIEGQWDAHEGTLTLVNFSTIEEFERALKSVSFSTTGDRAGKSLEIHIYDDSGELGSFEVPIDVHAVNESPQLDTHSSTVLNLPDETQVTPFPQLTLTEPDNDLIASATIAFDPEDYIAGEDLLGFTDDELITGTFSPETGELLLSGLASVSQYESALRRVTYRNEGVQPTAGLRNLSVSVVDARSAVAHIGAAMAVMAANEQYAPPKVTAGVPGTLPATSTRRLSCCLR